MSRNCTGYPVLRSRVLGLGEQIRCPPSGLCRLDGFVTWCERVGVRPVTLAVSQHTGRMHVLCTVTPCIVHPPSVSPSSPASVAPLHPYCHPPYCRLAGL
eukprot:1195657-Prorocentrum_minimum.AAC.3